MTRHILRPLVFAILLPLSGCGGQVEADPGTERRPLRVMLVPADGGTERGTRADFESVFHAVGRARGLHFDIKVGQSYNAVIQAMAAGQVDLAFFGAVSYKAARDLDAAELLAVSVKDGESVYYSGFFTRKSSGITSLGDLRGRSVAFGDLNSTSSFNFPVAMLLDAGLDPAEDLGVIVMAGSHAASLEAMATGKVDVAAASYLSFERAVENGGLDAAVVVPIARSEPIPNPPLAMHPSLPAELKAELREAFHTVHEHPDLQPEMLRGYGGKRVDRYDAEYDAAKFDQVMSGLARVTGLVKAAILRKASGG